jgi:hypothetical protein
MPLHRAQLYVRVCDASDAGTDDGIEASLASGNYTRMNYGRDDFERNSAFTYDLKLDGISAISRLTRLRIRRVGGDDAVKLCSASLLINGRQIYARSFGSGLWLDADGSHASTFEVSRGTMDDLTAWRNYVPPAVSLNLSRAEIESRIEAHVGDAIAGNRLDWGGLNGRAYVEASRKTSSTVAVDLDLTYDLPLLPDPRVDVDFDLVAPSDGSLRLTPINVRVDLPIYFELVFRPLAFFVDKIKSAFDEKVQVITQFFSSIRGGIEVLSDGAIRFF